MWLPSVFDHKIWPMGCREKYLIFLVPFESHAIEDQFPGKDADVRLDVGFLKRSVTGLGTKGIVSQKNDPKINTRLAKTARCLRLHLDVVNKPWPDSGPVIAHVGKSGINLSHF